MADKITSLCYVRNRGEKTTEFCRIADYNEGDYIPYRFNMSESFFENERDLLYGLTAALQGEEGSIVVIEWHAFLNAQNKWYTEVSKSDREWCEIIETNCESMAQLVKLIRTGLPMDNRYDRLHDIIICCLPVDGMCDSLLIRKTDAIYRDGKLCLVDSVQTLPHERLDFRYAAGECKCRYSPNDKRKYLSNKDACHVVGQYEIKTREEVVAEIIRQNIGKEGLARKERQAARSALDKLAIPTIIDRIAERFQCSVDQAEIYAKQYISTTKEKLDSATSIRLIEMLVENDSDAAQQMRNIIQQQWDESQQEQIKAAQQRLNKEELALKNIRRQITEAESALQTIEKKKLDTETQVEEALKLKEKIGIETRKRLDSFQTDYASALVDNALFSPTFLPAQQSATGITAEGGDKAWKIELPMGSIETSVLEDNLDVAIEDWNDISDDERMACGLSLLSFSAYAKKQPLLMLGEGGTLVTDLISSSICGQRAIRIHATAEMPNYGRIISEIEKCPKAVICVLNGLKTGYEYLQELMEMCSHRMFVITERHAESLAMEPVSLFSSFIPVFCDYFYTGSKLTDYSTYDCSDSLCKHGEMLTARDIKEARSAVTQWFNRGFYPPAMRERCTNMVAMMRHLGQLINTNTDTANIAGIEFVLMPMMKCLGRQKSLKEHIEESNILDSDQKHALCEYVFSGE